MTAHSTLNQPRAIGAAHVSVKQRDGGTHIDQLRQSGALKLLFPRRKRDVQAVVINTAGGITGGDTFMLRARAGPGTDLTVTTQAAERVYRAQPQQTGRVRTKLQVDTGAQLTWAPQETILFNRGALDRRLIVDLAGDARFLMVEPLLFGRKAMGEDISELRFDDRIVIRRDGEVIYRDGLHMHGPVGAALDRPAIGDGARAMASLVLVTPEASGHVDPLREIIGHSGGASLLDQNLLVVRLLAEDGFALRRCLLPVLDRLTKNTLPQSWRL